jgi:hypothetical protein
MIIEGLVCLLMIYRLVYLFSLVLCVEVCVFYVYLNYFILFPFYFYFAECSQNKKIIIDGSMNIFIVLLIFSTFYFFRFIYTTNSTQESKYFFGNKIKKNNYYLVWQFVTGNRFEENIVLE